MILRIFSRGALVGHSFECYMVGCTCVEEIRIKNKEDAVIQAIKAGWAIFNVSGEWRPLCPKHAEQALIDLG